MDINPNQEKVDKMMQDAYVNHPSHYKMGNMECIDGIKGSMTDSDFRGYLKGNVIKYLWRYKWKHDPVEDLKKAQWYLSKLIEEVEAKPENANDYIVKGKLNDIEMGDVITGYPKPGHTHICVPTTMSNEASVELLKNDRETLAEYIRKSGQTFPGEEEETQ